jgi:hypothetical protein
MKQSKKQDVVIAAIAKLNRDISDIANQLIKNNIKIPRKNPRYANKLGKKLMRGGGAIDADTIASIEKFLQDNKDTVIQLKNKLILDILELYKYIVELNGLNYVNDNEIVLTFNNICNKLLDNSKNIYDYTLNTNDLFLRFEPIDKDKETYSTYLANINNTIYILQFINIYYTIYDKNKKDAETDTFGNNNTDLEKLLKEALIADKSIFKDALIADKSIFKDALLIEFEKKNLEFDKKVLEFKKYDLKDLKFLNKNRNNKPRDTIRNGFEVILKKNVTYNSLKQEEDDINIQLKNENPEKSTQLITRIDKYITKVENFKDELQKLYNDYMGSVSATGGNPPAKYKSTGIAVCILYKKRKYKRTVYVKEMKKTKYCKIDGDYILLSKMKIFA